jgi:hypothetical protein
MKAGTSNKSLGPQGQMNQKIEGFDSSLAFGGDTGSKTVNVEGIGPTEFRNEPVSAKAESVSLVGEEVQGPMIRPSEIPEPALGQTKMTSQSFVCPPQAPMPIGIGQRDLKVGIPDVISTYAEYANAIDLASHLGIKHLNLTGELFDELNNYAKAPPERGNPDIQWRVHNNVFIYKVGTKDLCEKWLNRHAP